MILGQGHGTFLGHGQYLCEKLSRSHTWVRSYSLDMKWTDGRTDRVIPITPHKKLFAEGIIIKAFVKGRSTHSRGVSVIQIDFSAVISCKERDCSFSLHLVTFSPDYQSPSVFPSSESFMHFLSVFDTTIMTQDSCIELTFWSPSCRLDLHLWKQQFGWNMRITRLLQKQYSHITLFRFIWIFFVISIYWYNPMYITKVWPPQCCKKYAFLKYYLQIRY